jgi:hypothetical protein
MPDAGESESADGNRFPSDLSKSTAMKTTPIYATYCVFAGDKGFWHSELTP